MTKTYFCDSNKGDFITWKHYLRPNNFFRFRSWCRALSPSLSSFWLAEPRPWQGTTPDALSTTSTSPITFRKSSKKNAWASLQGNLTINEQCNNVKPNCFRRPCGKMYQASQSTGWTWMTVTEIGRRTAIFLQACELCCHAQSLLLSWCLEWTWRRSRNGDFIWHTTSGPRGKTASCNSELAYLLMYVQWYEILLKSHWYKTWQNDTLSISLKTKYNFAVIIGWKCIEWECDIKINSEYFYSDGLSQN